jgi:hypothetical protein
MAARQWSDPFGEEILLYLTGAEYQSAILLCSCCRSGSALPSARAQEHFLILIVAQHVQFEAERRSAETEALEHLERGTSFVRIKIGTICARATAVRREIARRQ